MDKIRLSRELSSIANMSAYNLKFEQYQTDIKTAINFLFFADSMITFKLKRVADLGCGNGILGIGASLLGAEEVDMYDIDIAAINSTNENINALHLKGCNAIHRDMFDISEKYDIALANPPFGFQTNFSMESFITKLHEISDTFFLIYKYNNYITAFAGKHNLHVYSLGEMRLKKTASFHKHESTSLPVCIVYHVGK